jgi:hypothetical protein
MLDAVPGRLAGGSAPVVAAGAPALGAIFALASMNRLADALVEPAGAVAAAPALAPSPWRHPVTVTFPVGWLVRLLLVGCCAFIPTLNATVSAATALTHIVRFISSSFSASSCLASSCKVFRSRGMGLQAIFPVHDPLTDRDCADEMSGFTLHDVNLAAPAVLAAASSARRR